MDELRDKRSGKLSPAEAEALLAEQARKLVQYLLHETAPLSLSAGRACCQSAVGLMANAAVSTRPS